MKNLEIRMMIKNNRLYHYEVAQKLGVSEYTLCRWLREELSDERKGIIIDAITSIVCGDKE